MDSFDTVMMPNYLGLHVPFTDVTPPIATADATSHPVFPLDIQDHHTNFDAETFVGSEELNFGPHGLPTPARLQRLSTSYDDPFSDAMSVLDNPLIHGHTGIDDPSIERDNKLLSFSPPVHNFTLLDYAHGRTTIQINAQLHGMFFLAESPFATGKDGTETPTELTCYRRNLFQINGSITLSRTLRCIITEQGEQIPIIGQELQISATESVENNPVKIISVPWKTTAANPNAIEDKVEKEPHSILLDLMTQDLHLEDATFPIAWKRLQFRIATANNGRRKELQQYFVIRLKVVATLATGNRTQICEARSGPIIVRGRSPRNFQSRKEFPLAGASHPTRKSTASQRGDFPRHNSYRSGKDVSPPPFGFKDNPFSPDFFEWKFGNPQQGATTTMADPISYPQIPAFDAFPKSSPEITRPSQSHHVAIQPIGLSLTEEEPETIKDPTPLSPPRKFARVSVARSTSFSVNPVNSPDEAADMLYEYFPLGLDDWMPPVDAVYRPHVVHHIDLPVEKTKKGMGRSKRYFSESHPD